MSHLPKNTHVSSAIEVFLLNTCLKSIGFFVSIQSTNKFLIAREILVGFSIYCRDIIFSRITDHGAENAYFEHQTENTEKSENTYSLNCINNGKELGRIVFSESRAHFGQKHRRMRIIPRFRVLIVSDVLKLQTT